MTDHLQALPAGHRLNEYRIERVIGSGGFGITYRAWDIQLDKVVAIKEYFPNDFAVRSDATSVRPKSTADHDDYQWGLARFLDEARTLARFEHPHLNHVHRYFEDNNTAYLVLDYIEGETLSDLIKREGRLESTRLQRLVTELLSGLDEVHSADYVHRDVKPSNIMLRKNGSSVLLDFGNARQVLGQRSKSLTSVLTPGYAPIEQYDQKGDVGPWTDLYALGMVAYRCVSGIIETELIDAITRAQLAHKGKQDQDMAPAVEVGKGHYPLSLLKAIDWAIKVEEDERPQSVAAIKEMIAGDEVSDAVPDAAPADQGHANANAQYSLGFMYAEGRGVAQDDAEAAKWYRKSAEQGHADAQNNLGWMYEKGRGVNKDDAEAVKRYRKAAEQGHADAQNNLGRMYEKGRGVAQDYAEAVKWYRKAAEQGDMGAQNHLGWMYQYGIRVSQDYAEAAKWYRKAAEQGDVFAQSRLGRMYEKGRGVAQDYAEAVKWYRKAAEQGDAFAQNILSVMYFNGLGVAQDYAEAIKWYRKAAEQGDANAQNHLGWMYAKGKGVAQDDAEAAKWYRKAAEQGDANVQNYLGFMYYNGQGVNKDDAEAVKWYRKAAEQGYAQAQYNLGWMYEYGRGVAQDYAEAAKWYRKAADQGHDGAKMALRKL